MFVHDESRSRLDIEADQVLRLRSSVNPVQVALEGYPGQRAGALICLHQKGQGIEAVVVLEMFDSRCLVFYCHEQGVLPVQQADALVKEGLHFLESMGFLMTDLEFETLDTQARQHLWQQLSLRTGVPQPPKIFAEGYSGLAGKSSRSGAETGRSGRQAPPNEEYGSRRRRLIDNAGRILAAF